MSAVQRFRDHHDALKRLLQYAQFHDLDVQSFHGYPSHVELVMPDYDQARRLAAGFDLSERRSFRHTHSAVEQLHTSWWSADRSVQVVNVSRMEQVGGWVA